MSTQFRLNRLFGPDGKCCEVAMDHGIHNETSFLPGLENLQHVIESILSAGADAFLLGLGQAAFLQTHPGRHKPSLVLRADPTNVYGSPAPSHVFCELLDNVVEMAVALDAVGLVVNLIWIPDRPELHYNCVANISKLKPQCERLGMPLIVEALLMEPNQDSGGYKHNSDTARSVALVRQAVELGADAVKTDPLNDLEDYYKVIETASGKPVLLRGGSRVSDHELFSRTYALMHQGAAGVVYGRNIYQHAQPARMLEACSAIVHKNATVEQAELILQGIPSIATHG